MLSYLLTISLHDTYCTNTVIYTSTAAFYLSLGRDGAGSGGGGLTPVVGTGGVTVVEVSD
jgi:hypothetical protein